MLTGNPELHFSISMLFVACLIFEDANQAKHSLCVNSNWFGDILGRAISVSLSDRGCIARSALKTPNTWRRLPSRPQYLSNSEPIRLANCENNAQLRTVLMYLRLTDGAKFKPAYTVR